MDMPATSEGVDVFPGSSRPIDYSKVANRLKKNGTAIHDGESILITKIKVKGENVEIHLGGGGYGTFGDVFGSELTNQGADSGTAQQARIANERTARLSAGSRFNLRYPNGVTPEDLTPVAVGERAFGIRLDRWIRNATGDCCGRFVRRTGPGTRHSPSSECG